MALSYDEQIQIEMNRIKELKRKQKLEKARIEYSRAVTPQIRQAGNRLSGLAETAYASLLA